MKGRKKELPDDMRKVMHLLHKATADIKPLPGAPVVRLNGDFIEYTYFDGTVERKPFVPEPFPENGTSHD